MANGDACDWYSEPCLLGIDEAGRGPVLGPMVYASAYCPLSHQEELKGWFADSKTLKEDKREALFGELGQTSWIGFDVENLSAEEISCRMLRPDRESLNKLANEATFGVIRQALVKGVNVTEVYVDTVGDSDTHRARLEREFPGIKFTVCPKADAIYPIVSAASIVAKVTRDRHVRDCSSGLQELVQLKGAMGSGYPADPDTKQWLQSNFDPVFGFPSVLRFSWQTASRIMDAQGPVVKWACEEDDECTQVNKLPFAPVGGNKRPGPTSGTGRHPFFRSRKLQRVTEAF